MKCTRTKIDVHVDSLIMEFDKDIAKFKIFDAMSSLVIDSYLCLNNFLDFIIQEEFRLHDELKVFFRLMQPKESLNFVKLWLHYIEQKLLASLEDSEDKNIERIEQEVEVEIMREEEKLQRNMRASSK